MTNIGMWMLPENIKFWLYMVNSDFFLTSLTLKVTFSAKVDQSGTTTCVQNIVFLARFAMVGGCDHRPKLGSVSSTGRLQIKSRLLIGKFRLNSDQKLKIQTTWWSNLDPGLKLTFLFNWTLLKSFNYKSNHMDALHDIQYLNLWGLKGNPGRSS